MAAADAAWPAAVGVSGGSDSLALMILLAGWAKAHRREPPVVLCVDHGLRSEAGAEARQVRRWALAAGLRAHVLSHWGKRPHADVEAQARKIRYALMGEWAVRHGVRAIYVGHTRDDQAETFLLRLGRGSGVDGLAAMRPVSAYPDPRFAGLLVVRPLLGIGRVPLRDFLSEQGQPWLEDPMNADPQFARVRMRHLLPSLEAAGLSAARIADAAVHLERARSALEVTATAVLARACMPDEGGMLVDARALAAAPRELGLRALATVLMAVSGEPYRPRFERLEALFDAMCDGSLRAGRTLHGCRIAPAPRAKAAFGSGTLAVQPEERDRKSTGNATGRAKRGY